MKYSDFQNDTIDFINKITNYLNIKIPEKEIEELAVKANPVQLTTDSTKHKRSGKSQQYFRRTETRNC